MTAGYLVDGDGYLDLGECIYAKFHTFGQQILYYCEKDIERIYYATIVFSFEACIVPCATQYIYTTGSSTRLVCPRF
jgi:hypothetical protein